LPFEYLYCYEQLGLASSGIATTVTTAIATTSTASATATISTTAAATTFFAWTSFVDCQSTTIELFVMQSIDRITSSIFICHFDESKTLASTGVTVLDDLSAAHCTELCKHLFQALVGNTIGQVTDVKFLTQNPKLPKKLTNVAAWLAEKDGSCATLAIESEEQTDSNGIKLQLDQQLHRQ
jgi:hypothetical protein